MDRTSNRKKRKIQPARCRSPPMMKRSRPSACQARSSKNRPSRYAPSPDSEEDLSSEESDLDSSDAGEFESEQGREDSPSSDESSDESGQGYEVTLSDPYDKVFVDVRKLDKHAQVHGSVVTGLYTMASDMDVVMMEPLYRVLTRATSSPLFVVKESIPKARVPRLVLAHVTTGVEIDCISAYCSPSLASDGASKDAMIRAYIGIGQHVFDYLCLIKSWFRAISSRCPPRMGYPNGFVGLMVGLYYLVQRPGGAVVPPLPPRGEALPLNVKKKALSVMTGAALFTEYLEFVRDKVVAARVDLRQPRARLDRIRACVAVEGMSWEVICPVSGRMLCEFRNEQAVVISRLAASKLRESKWHSTQFKWKL